MRGNNYLIIQTPRTIGRKEVQELQEELIKRFGNERLPSIEDGQQVETIQVDFTPYDKARREALELLFNDMGENKFPHYREEPLHEQFNNIEFLNPKNEIEMNQTFLNLQRDTNYTFYTGTTSISKLQELTCNSYSNFLAVHYNECYYVFMILT